MAPALHALLARQVRSLSLDATGLPTAEQWTELLTRVSRAYSDADQDRYTLERSIEISGKETRELYAQLTRDHATLQASRERERAVFEDSAVGQALIDQHGCCTEINPALSNMLGWATDELVGRELLELLVPADRAAFAQPLAELLAGTQQRLAGEQQWRTKSDAGLWVNLTLSLVHATGSQPRFAALLVQDVNERKRLEVELRHSQKLESVGRLAAGIAHEINTPVQFVGDNVPFLEEAMAAVRKLRKRYRELLVQAIAAGSVDEVDVTRAEQEADIEYLDAEVPRALAQTADGIQRVATIVRAMKEFANHAGGDSILTDLNRALDTAIAVLRSELKAVADVQIEFGDIPHVRCHLGDLNQAFLNILVNAGHAIADVIERDGGRGTIRVSTAREGDCVLVQISDTGGGIPDDVRPCIFEPFFTTKEVGRGTGQGLALARSVVVDRHHGKLSFTSRLGEGTTFEIRLPIDYIEAARKKKAAALGVRDDDGNDK